MPDFTHTAANVSLATQWFYFGLATQLPTAIRNLGTASLRGLKGHLGQLVNSVPIYINLAAHFFLTTPLAFGLSKIPGVQVAGTFIAPLVAISFTAFLVFVFWKKVQNETATLTGASLRKMFSLPRKRPEGYSELEEAPLQNTA